MHISLRPWPLRKWEITSLKWASSSWKCILTLTFLTLVKALAILNMGIEKIEPLWGQFYRETAKLLKLWGLSQDIKFRGRVYSENRKLSEIRGLSHLRG